MRTLPADFRFFNYQRTVNARTAQVPSHAVIEDYLAEYGRDYRYEDAPHPVKALQDREKDNTRVGRTAAAQNNARPQKAFLSLNQTDRTNKKTDNRQKAP